MPPLPTPDNKVGGRGGLMSYPRIQLRKLVTLWTNCPWLKEFGGSNGQGENRPATRYTNLISLGSQLKVKMADMTFGS